MKKLLVMLGFCAFSLTAYAGDHVHTVKLNNGYLSFNIINKSAKAIVGYGGMQSDLPEYHSLAGMMMPGEQTGNQVVAVLENQTLNFFGANVSDHCDIDFNPQDKDSVVVTIKTEYPNSDCDIDQNGVITVDFRNITHS